MTNPIALTPYYQASYPTGAINGLNVAWGSNTTLTVAAGTCRDSTDRCNMALGSSVTINAANAGVANGLDAGALANSTQYAIHLIGDSTGNKATAALVSTSATAPSLPTGYDMFRLVGYWFTDGSAHFWLGYYFGSSNYRKFEYDIVQSVLAAGVATSFTAIDLSAFVPSLTSVNTPVSLEIQYTPASAGNKASFRPTGATAATPRDVTGVVASQPQDLVVNWMTGFASSKAELDYKVASGSDSLNVKVAGFELSL